jgi:hypothetical protein
MMDKEILQSLAGQEAFKTEINAGQEALKTEIKAGQEGLRSEISAVKMT